MPNVIKLPLEELVSPEGDVLVRRDALGREEIRQLLRQPMPPQFVVANVGHALRWVDRNDTYTFWKSDASVHVFDEAGADLDEMPDGYAYFASGWTPSTSILISVVLLEMAH